MIRKEQLVKRMDKKGVGYHVAHLSRDCYYIGKKLEVFSTENEKDWINNLYTFKEAIKFIDSL